MNDLVRREDLYYQKFTDTPFTGQVDEGLERDLFQDGKREGSWLDFWYNGQLLHKGDYKNGKREGFWITTHRKINSNWFPYCDSS